MRGFSLFLLLATAAVPALAAPDSDEGGRRHRGNDSAEQSESRPQPASEGGRSRGEQRFESRRSDGGEARAARTERLERAQATQQTGQESNRDRMREHIRQQREERAQAVAAQPANETEGVRSVRRGDGNVTSGQTNWRARERQVRTIPDTQPAVSTQNRRGEIARSFEGRRRPDYRNGDYRRWSSTRWRNDHRYDWRRWRDNHRSLFRLGFYYDPFGWSYRRWSLGSYLYPSYYGSRYWLNDPWHYRLPQAYGPYRWVRYWDDALLVNIYTGQVVDVIHNFFW